MLEVTTMPTDHLDRVIVEDGSNMLIESLTRRGMQFEANLVNCLLWATRCVASGADVIDLDVPEGELQMYLDGIGAIHALRRSQSLK